jgi:hypothetical protein
MLKKKFVVCFPDAPIENFEQIFVQSCDENENVVHMAG